MSAPALKKRPLARVPVEPVQQSLHKLAFGNREVSAFGKQGGEPLAGLRRQIFDRQLGQPGISGACQQGFRQQIPKVFDSLFHKQRPNRLAIGGRVGAAGKRDCAQSAFEPRLHPLPRPAQQAATFDAVGKPLLHLARAERQCGGDPRSLGLSLRITDRKPLRAREWACRVELVAPPPCAEPGFARGATAAGEIVGQGKGKEYAHWQTLLLRTCRAKSRHLLHGN